MKPLFLTLFLILVVTPSFAAPRGIKVTNRQFTDGSGGSSKVTDPEKGTAEETFMDSKGRTTHKIIYTLDARQQPIAAAYYNATGVLTYNAAYKLDGADRIAQEVMTDPKGNLLFTRNYTYGTKEGRSVVVGVDTYDSQNRLVPPPAKKNSSKKRR